MFHEAQYCVTKVSARVVVETPAESLDVEGLRQRLFVENCGSIVSFVGLTRGIDNGQVIEALEFETWEGRLTDVLRNIGETAIEQFGISGVAIAHRSGRVEPEEPIVAIHVSSPHRPEGFDACKWVIETLKAEAPLWKSEVCENGRRWVGGLG